jgi:CRISPR/Cas system-associated exonuclease Cas4 (RecB family)
MKKDAVNIPVIENIEQEIQDLVITKLSPSHFSYLINGCRYQFLLSQIVKNQPKYKLPSYPKTLLGDIIHKIIALRYCGVINNEDDFDLQWKNLVSEKEIQNYGKSDTGLLIDWIKYYKTKRFVFSIPYMPYIESDKSKPKTSELRIWDIDYLHGSIDRVIISENKVELVDFKTGEIFEQDGSIKQSYSAQLKLYAIMYQKKYAETVERLSLQDIDNNSVDVVFTQQELDELYQQVINEIRLLNKKEYSLLVKNEPGICSKCSVRHLCSYYWESEISENDVCGRLESINANNSLIRIISNGKQNTISQMSIYSSDELKKETGNNVRILNLSKPREVEGGNLYNSQVWSRIYVVKGCEINEM